MSLSYQDAEGEQQEIPLSDVEAACEAGTLVDTTQVRRKRSALTSLYVFHLTVGDSMG
jgi:hypothetical protein